MIPSDIKYQFKTQKLNMQASALNNLHINHHTM